MVAGAARLPGPADRRARLGRAGVFDLPALKARTLGHASLALYREGEAPLLVTDPWLVGSAYWRSWWLQHYPDAEEIDWLARSAHVYVTHEHPDHFHMPSIRRLGRGPTYLFPDLAERRYLDYMAGRGYRAEVVAPRRWRAIGGGVSILSIPVWSDDSLLLADTPAALILNLNDAKPLPPVLRAIRRAADRIDKPRVLLCSYSPASLVNSFLDDAGVVSLKPARHYVDYVCRLCDRLAADFYMPFASQAVFERADSRWANDYRTTHAGSRAALALARHLAAALLDPRPGGPHPLLDPARAISGAGAGGAGPIDPTARRSRGGGRDHGRRHRCAGAQAAAVSPAAAPVLPARLRVSARRALVALRPAVAAGCATAARRPGKATSRSRSPS